MSPCVRGELVIGEWCGNHGGMSTLGITSDSTFIFRLKQVLKGSTNKKVEAKPERRVTSGFFNDEVDLGSLNMWASLDYRGRSTTLKLNQIKTLTYCLKNTVLSLFFASLLCVVNVVFAVFDGEQFASCDMLTIDHLLQIKALNDIFIWNFRWVLAVV